MHETEAHEPEVKLTKEERVAHVLGLGLLQRAPDVASQVATLCDVTVERARELLAMYKYVNTYQFIGAVLGVRPEQAANFELSALKKLGVLADEPLPGFRPQR